jgi:hypothetical protein
MDQSLAMIDLENAINLLLPEISPYIPQKLFAKFCKYKEDCLYFEALECVTEYIDPFVETLQAIPVALLFESWTLLCKFRRLRVEREEWHHKKYNERGQEGSWVQYTIDNLEFERKWLELSERGKKKAAIYLERQRKSALLINSTGTQTSTVTNMMTVK